MFTPRRTRSKAAAVTPARTPRKDYCQDPVWMKGVLVAAGNEAYRGLTLSKVIQAAARDSIDLEAMRPKGLSRSEKNRLDMAWERTYDAKLCSEGPELDRLLWSASNVLALHNDSELRAHAATLTAHGIDIKTLCGTVKAQGAKIEAQDVKIEGIGSDVKALDGRFGMLAGVVFLLFVLGSVSVFFMYQNASMPAVVEGPPASAFENNDGELGSALASKRISQDSNGLIADASISPPPFSSEAVFQGQEESVADDKAASGIRSASAGDVTQLSPSSVITTEAADEVVAAVGAVHGDASREIEMGDIVPTADSSQVDTEPSHELSVPSAHLDPTTKDLPPTDKVSGALFVSTDSNVSPCIGGGVSEAQSAVSEEEEEESFIRRSCMFILSKSWEACKKVANNKWVQLFAICSLQFWVLGINVW